MSSQGDVADFFSHWSVYRAVIENNLMEHREVFSLVHPILASRTSPYSLLDLGCGDAAAIGPAMAGTQIRRYVGVDLAAPALDFAREVLADSDAEIDLQVGDLMDTIEAAGELFDIILISFALHHFDDAGKRRFLAAARNRLAPGGELLLIDVVRRDGETREQYLDRYAGLVADWPIDADKRDRIVAHVRGNDFPAEVSAQPPWAAELGYTVEQFYRGGADTQSGWRMAV